MLTVILALTLAGSYQGIGDDGGVVPWDMNCLNCSGGGGQSSIALDGGHAAVSVDNFPATQAVTQSTGSNLHVAVDSAPTTAVTGTFWQSTQPTSLATLPALTTGSAVIGKVGIDQTTPGTTNAVQLTVPTGGNPCQNPYATLAGIAGATSGTAAVQLIALSGSTKIYVCSMTITGISGTTPTFSLKYGTGTACAVGGVTLVGPYTTTANTTQTWVQPFVTPAGQELCYLDTGTSPVQNYAITYVQL